MKTFHKNRQKGISLTELAIVLGVFAFVVGALWSVVSTVRENAKREQALQQALVVVRNVRSHYQGVAKIEPTSLMSNLIARKVLPKDMLNSGATAALNPWGGAFSVQASSADNNCNNSAGQYFCLAFSGLNEASCVALATTMSGSSAAPPGITGVKIQAAATRTAFPVSVSTALGDCASTGNTVRLIYKLRQQEE